MSQTGRFPPIADSASSKAAPSSSSRRTASPDSSSGRLPKLPSHRGELNSTYVGKENAMVVGTSTSFSGDALPDEWTQMRVNAPQQQDDTQMTKLEWENQIAKHILSLFATSHAVKNINEGTALLDFVEVDKSGVKPHRTTSGANTDLLHTRPQRPMPVPEAPNEEEEDGENADVNQNNGTEERRKKIKKKVKKSKKKRAEVDAEAESDAPVQPRSRGRPPGVSESDYAIAERVILRVHAEAEAQEKAKGKTKAHEKDKHRITNTIKLKDGQEIVVRGTPRCFPIWFVSTGDVYADWTSLPGGVKLQAHLNVLYEQQKYNDYLGIIETLITEMWRKVKYGKEDFTLGSFGHSAAVTATPSASNTGTNTGTNTGSNTARSASRPSRSGAHSKHRHSHSGGAFPTSPAQRSGFSPEAREGGSPLGGTIRGAAEDEDSVFGAPVVWQDAGEEGLIPVKTASSPVRGADVGAKKGVGHRPTLQRSNSYEPGGTMTGVGQDSPGQLPDQLLPPSALVKLWKQMILAAIAMGILYLEKKVPDQAMLLFKRAEEWASNDEIVASRMTRKELNGHVRDAISYYFFKRKKSIAALGYSEQAMALYEETDNLDGIAVCMLHCAAVYSQIGDFKEAHKKLFQFLAMVEGGRLAAVDATPKQLCLVAIGYHNLAVVQLKLAMPDLACKNSQNARKIARLCLSYSNRWIDTFQYTHEICISDIKYELSSKNAGDLTPAQLALVIELSEALFDPYSDSNQDASVT